MDDRSSAAGRPLVLVTAHVRVLFAVRGLRDDDPDQPVVVLGFGETFADAETVSISLDDAWLLRRLVTAALDSPSTPS